MEEGPEDEDKDKDKQRMAHRHQCESCVQAYESPVEKGLRKAGESSRMVITALLP